MGNLRLVSLKTQVFPHPLPISVTMDFRYGGSSNDYPSPFVSSSSIYTNFSVQPPEEGLRRKSVSGGARSESFRELEKEMIREEILAEEAERRRVLEAEVRFELMMEREMMAMQSWQANTSSFIQGPPHSHHSRYQSGVLYREFDCSEVVAPFQRRPRSPEITDTTTSLQSKVSERGTFGSEDHYGQIPSGAKRKPPPPPPSSVSRGSKKKTKDWCCALCKVSMTCELDLEDHLAGKKHLAKEAGLRNNKKVTINHKKGRKKNSQKAF